MPRFGTAATSPPRSVVSVPVHRPTAVADVSSLRSEPLLNDFGDRVGTTIPAATAPSSAAAAASDSAVAAAPAEGRLQLAIVEGLTVYFRSQRRRRSAAAADSIRGGASAMAIQCGVGIGPAQEPDGRQARHRASAASAGAQHRRYVEATEAANSMHI